MYILLLAFLFQYGHYNITITTQNLKIILSIIIRCGSDLGQTMCPPAATCGKSDRARIGTWEQVGQFLHGLLGLIYEFQNKKERKFWIF